MGATRLRPVGEGGHIIEDEGVPLAQRPALNFLGDGVIASDSPGKTDVTIPGGAGGGGVWRKVADFTVVTPASSVSTNFTETVNLDGTEISRLILIYEYSVDADSEMRYGINGITGLTDYNTNGGLLRSLGYTNLAAENEPGWRTNISLFANKKGYAVLEISGSAGLDPGNLLNGFLKEHLGERPEVAQASIGTNFAVTSISSMQLVSDDVENIKAGSRLTAYVEDLSGGGGGGGGGHVIEDEGTPLAQRADLNFVGAGVTAADTGGKTVVTIPGGGGEALDTINVGLLREEFAWTDPALVFAIQKYELSGSGTQAITNASFYTGLYGNQSLTTGTALLTHVAEFLSGTAFPVEPFISDITMTQVVLMRPTTLTSALVVCAMMGATIGAVLSPTTDTNFLAENDIGFGFIFDPNTSANWQIFSVVGGVFTKTITTVTAVAGPTSSLGIRTKLRAIYTRATPKIEFEIDGVNVGTITTNIPNDATELLNIYDLVANISGAGFGVIELDMWEVQVGRDGDIPSGGGGAALTDKSVKARFMAMSDRVTYMDEFVYPNPPTEHYLQEGAFSAPTAIGGVIQMDGASNTGDRARIGVCGGGGITLLKPTSELVLRMRLQRIGSSTYHFFFGGMDIIPTGSPAATPDNFLGFRQINDGSNVFAVARNGGVETAVDLGVTLSVPLSEYAIIVTNGTAQFFIDDVLKATISTNIPAVNIQWHVVMITDHIGGNQGFLLDSLLIDNVR